MTICSKRFDIRPLTAEDKTLFFRLYTNPKVMRLISAPFHEQQAQVSFDTVLDSMAKKQGKFAQWVLIDRSSQKAIGLLGLMWPRHSRKEAEIGLMLIREANGKGIPEEILACFIPYAFIHLKLERIIASFSRLNLPAKRLAKKMGATFMGTDKQSPSLFCYLDKTSM